VQFKAHGDGVQVVLEGEDVSLSIRTEICGMNASKVASLTLVRKALQERQRAFAELPGLVADGRDMGTVIFPEAPVKVFLTASAQERADRRYKQLKSKGLSASLSNILTDIQKRDERDENRTVAPLKPSEDALVIDCTHMSILDVEQKILTFIHSKGVL